MRLLVILSALFLIACDPTHVPPSGDQAEGEAKQQEDVQRLLEAPEKIIYSDVAKLVLDKSCTKCHSDSGKNIANVNLESFESVFGKNSKSTVVPFDANASSLFSTLLVEKSRERHMPPIKESQLSEDEINLVYQWILNGAKKEVAQVVERPKTLNEKLSTYFKEPQKIDYPIVEKFVFSTSCMDCHSAHGSKSNFKDAMTYGPNMTSYEDLFNNFAIVPGRLIDTHISDGEGGKKKLRGSRIFKSVAVKQSMPNVEEGYEPLDALRVKLLRLWILNCAIEDFSAITEDDLTEEVDQDGKIRNCE